MNSIFSKLLTK